MVPRWRRLLREAGAPASDETGREIARPPLDPLRDRGRREELHAVDLRLGRKEWAVVFPAIEPNEFLACLLRRPQFRDTHERRCDAKLLVQFALAVASYSSPPPTWPAAPNPRGEVPIFPA